MQAPAASRRFTPTRSASAVACRNARRGKGRWCALLALAGTLAVPGTASAHARSATVALDYKLVLDRTAPGITATILDGDRDLRLRVPRGTLVVLGDLGEPMLRIGPDGVAANRTSVTAVAEKLTAAGRGWRQLASGSTYAWHEHRLSPPPYDAARVGAVARFRIPARLDGSRLTIAGTFVRVRRPALWPWLAGAAAAAAIVAAVLRLRPAARRPAAVVLGVAAAAAALVAFVSFATADATTGRISWAQIAVVAGLASAAAVALVRLQGARRSHLAGVLGAAAAALALSSLGVFRHGVVISSLPAGAARLLCATAVTGGAAALAASIAMTEER